MGPAGALGRAPPLQEGVAMAATLGRGAALRCARPLCSPRRSEPGQNCETALLGHPGAERSSDAEKALRLPAGCVGPSAMRALQSRSRLSPLQLEMATKPSQRSGFGVSTLSSPFSATSHY